MHTSNVCVAGMEHHAVCWFVKFVLFILRTFFLLLLYICYVDVAEHFFVSTQFVTVVFVKGG